MASRSGRKATTTDRGLGYRHRQQVEMLKRRHVDGSPCWWCDRPMYADPSRNPDGKVLTGDHSKPRAQGGILADRLMHNICNSERGDGYHDHLRPALGGGHGQQKAASGGLIDHTRLAMPWI